MPGGINTLGDITLGKLQSRWITKTWSPLIFFTRSFHHIIDATTFSPFPMYSSHENVNILTALLADYGVEHIVVCPGSRNAPIVHNFNEFTGFTCHPVTDERSAAFVALGIAQQTGSLVAVCVTSGSALLNVLPGAAEASYQHNGIIVISADRPSAWIGQLDGQTMPQPDALGCFVEKSVSLPECKDDIERWQCRRLVCEAMLTLLSKKRSVHINVPITEPLFNFTTSELPDIQGVFPLRWSDKDERDFFLDMLSHSLKPMIVIGQSEHDTINSMSVMRLRDGIVTLAEPLSTYVPSASLDDVFTSLGNDTEDYKPDFLIYLGSTTISKKLRLFLRTLDDCTVVMVNEFGDLEDVTQHASYVLKAEPGAFLDDLSSMLQFEKNAFGMAWDRVLDETRKQSQLQPVSITELAVQAFERAVSKEATVYYANSTAIRQAARYASHYVFCNRGINGIEGSLSTAVGASLVSKDNVYCVIGDLSFFYDQNALWNQHLRPNIRILLLNNGGGEIFRRLPGLEDSPARDEYVMASHHTTAVGACHQYGISRKAVSKAEDIPSAIAWLMEESTPPKLLEVITL